MNGYAIDEQTNSPVPCSRRHIVVRGAVQGVGFRPFVYRLATKLRLAGWVNNTSQGVFIEVEGRDDLLQSFIAHLETNYPPHALIQQIEIEEMVPTGERTFVVHHSDAKGAKTAYILPDLAICPDCLHEIRDPKNRRYRYPFTNCTNCGPRFSIIEVLPYDRANTTMRHFPMCPQCQAEYDDPADRRFHAQPNACPNCGPRVVVWDTSGRVLAEGDTALDVTTAALRAGKIVAVKGLGGFHLMVDACNDTAVRLLRERKAREAKPLALMFPSLTMVCEACIVSPLEADLLCSTEAPIVLLRRVTVTDRVDTPIAPSVAPGNPYLGVMLPSTPLHHLLLRDLGTPVVATSGNRSDEPICTDEHEALRRLDGITDLFLVHNRPIARPMDDSVVQVVMGEPQILRRARGYAPLPIAVTRESDAPPVVAVGAHLKNTVGLAVGTMAFLSQHIGDLDTAPAYDAFTRVAADLPSLYNVQSPLVACDTHPDYRSTQFAETHASQPLVRVQHHYAHTLACMTEHALEAPALGVAWDGTGYGCDGTIWGGEFLHVTPDGFTRVATFRPFGLPGGEAAIKEPRRAALGLLHAHVGDALWDMDDLLPVYGLTHYERSTFRAMLERGIHTPLTSSVGRLFDAVAALVGLRQRAQFEGQAAMDLQFAVTDDLPRVGYPFRIETTPEGLLIVDWSLLLDALLADLRHLIPVETIAGRFHTTLAHIIVTVAEYIDEPRVVLGGGCFQNKLLTESAISQLRAAGFCPYWPQRIPPNDGGIALGQIAAVARLAAASRSSTEPTRNPWNRRGRHVDVLGDSW